MKSRVVMACLLGLLCWYGPWARAQNVEPSDYNQVIQVPRQQINDWLKSEITRSGGDLNTARYHFIVGFSTGHYGQDPVHAIAMRRLAFSLLNNTMAIGDRVTAVAWEMHVWEKDKPVTLSEDPATRKQFVDDVPYTTQHGSRGGHDVERALFETLTQAVPPDETKSTVILLLTNSNQSQVPTGERAQLFGENNPRLVQAIRKAGYRSPPSRQSFTLQGKGRPLTVDITALFPKTLASLPGAPATPRYPTFAPETWQPAEDKPATTEKLPNTVVVIKEQTPGTTTTHVIERPAPEEKKSGSLWWLYVLGALLVVVLIVLGARAMASRPKTPTQAVVAAAPAGRPLPGAVEVVIGTQSTTLQPLTTLDKWALMREGENIVLQAEKPDGEKPGTEKPPGTRLATLTFDEKRRLRVEAEPDVQFVELRGVSLNDSNNRLLHVGMGERLFCRLAATDSPTPARLELVYHKEKK